MEIVDDQSKNCIAIGLPKGTIGNVVTSRDGNIEGLKLVEIVKKENSYSLRFKNDTTSFTIDCDKFCAYNPNLPTNYLEHENDMVILVNSDSINLKSRILDNFIVKPYIRNQYDADKKELDKYPNKLLVEGERLIVDIDIDNIKESLNWGKRKAVDLVVGNILNGKTKIELPINDILFSGKILNGLKTSKELLENKKEPSTMTKVVSGVEQHAPETGAEESRTL